MEEDEDLLWDDETYFVGECTCDHDEDVHGWGACEAPNGDGSVCLCEAGWEE